MDEPSYSVFETGADDQPIVQSSQHPEWFSQPKKPPTLDRDWNKTLPAVKGSTQTWISELAKQADSRSSFNVLLDTLLDFSNFIMNWLRVDTLTPELLAGPTFKLMKGSCISLIELEYHLEEVYKATTYQLDWVNPEGQQYPHNLLQPLSLIPDNRGRRVIPFAHFINNDLEYLRGGGFSRKYTTSVTKTKAADYGQIKWIEDLESALDVYSKRRIIAVTDLKIVEWHSYKHLDWITRRVKDLQLGVKSYQKRLNLTKLDTYRSDLKRREAYTAYSNPRGFIYQNKDKKNRLIQIDELYKFSDETLNDVRTALDDRAWKSSLEEGCMRETSGCCKGPYDLSYAAPIFNEQESSFVSSQFVTNMLNPTSDAATISTISHAPIPPTTIPSKVLQNLPTFDSVFRFDERLKSLEANFSEYIQTNRFDEAVSNIQGVVHQYMKQQMNEASVNAQLKAEVLTRSSHSSRTLYAVAANLSEMELKKILIEKMEGNKSIHRSDEQRNLYKALVEAYEADKIILELVRFYMNQTSDNWKETMVRFLIESNLFQVINWFTLIVLSALRRSNNKNMLSLINLILRSILTDLQVTPTKHG
nr:hypothetical protein [Tanacetum cinerariifolium]